MAAVQLYDKDGNVIEVAGDVTIQRQLTSGVPIAKINDTQLYAPQGGGGGGGTSYDEIGYPILDDTNPLAMLIKGRSRACLFKSWGIIGASFETAYMEVKLNGENTTYTDTGYDWVTLFGQMNSVTVGNFALAGRPLRYWLNSPSGFGAMQAANPMEAYVINSSTNDYSTDKYDEPVGDITTDIDYNDPDNNAATWVGCLATIIQKLRIKSPRCYIFMATVRRYTTNSSVITRITPYIQAQRDVCSCFDNVYLIDMWQYGIHWTDTDVKKAYLMGSHPTRNGHIYLADAFNTYIDWLIFKNPIGMRDASFVGTDYQDRNNY